MKSYYGEHIMNFNTELWNELKPSDSIIRGLKARLMFCDQTLLCTPANKCGCEHMLEDLQASEEWISSLPGEPSYCDE